MDSSAQHISFVAYRQLHCLKRIHDEALGGFIPLAMFIMVYTHSFINFTLIRNRSMPPYFILVLILAGLVFFVSCNVFIGSGGRVGDTSMEIKRRMCRTTNSVLKKDAYSCPILNVEVGPFGRLSRDSVILYLSIMTENVIELILFTN